MAVLLLIWYLPWPVEKGMVNHSETRFELEKNWPNLPGTLKLGNPTGIDMDTSQNVVVFHRAEREWPTFGAFPEKKIESKTILIIDKDDGKLLNSWGDHLFIMPHGLKVDKANNIWVTDVGLHQVLKFSYDGKLLLSVGEARVPGNDSLHFDQPTDIAVTDDGSFYVSDGYGNSRVVKFSASGQYLSEWGTKGDKENEFDIPHGIALDSSGNVVVADRENHRIQVFNPEGKFIRQLSDNSFGAICAVEVNKSTLLAVDYLTFAKLKHHGSDVLVFDTAGKLQTRFGRSGLYQGHTSWYHDLTVDQEGNIYVGDILGNTLQKFRKVVKPGRN